MKSKNKNVLVIGVFIVILGTVGALILSNHKSKNPVEKCDQQYAEAIKVADTPESQLRFSRSRDICYSLVARKAQDSNICSLIKEESIKDLCSVHVYYWNKSVEDCQKDEQKNICLHILSIREGDKNICKKIDDNAIKKLCLGE